MLVRAGLLVSAALLVEACAPTYLPPEEVDSADAQRLGNWAEEDTNGVGTHRVVADALNVRTQAGAVIGLASKGQQLVTTTAKLERSGVSYLEVVFKGGELDGTTGWVAGQYLAHTELEVCGGASAQVRAESDLGRVVSTARSGDRLFVTSGTVRNTGTFRYFLGSVNGVRGWVATDSLCATGGGGGGGGAAGGSDAGSILALHHDGVTVLWNQTFGRYDGASALDNIEDAAAGRPALTSCYGGAPCDEVSLDPELLRAMNELVTRYGYSYFVTTIAGAAHSSGSLHYYGRAFDVDEINGVRVYGDTSTTRAFMNACWALGAVEVFGPSNDPVGHYDHLHCAF
jgi:zinc D-Ala-D-Ala carboxypeptidase